MMPLLFSLGQHKALVRAQSQMAPGEVLLVFLDDVHIVSPPGRVSTVHNVLDEALWSEAGIRIHQGKTQIWNQAGEKPEGCGELERVAVAADPTAVVWRGSPELPSHKSGMKVLGTPLGHADFIRDHLEKIAAEHQVLLDRIPLVGDVQFAWLLLVHCAAAMAPLCVELLNLPQWSISAGPMMNGCGGACVPLSRCLPNNQRKWFR